MITNQEIFNGSILIVDDESISLTLLAQILKKAGYQKITTLSDSREAISSYEKLTPDLLILDLNMPHISGLEIIHQLKTKFTEDYLPILILTSADDKNLRQTCLDSGAKDFVNKPYDKNEVLSRCRNIIEVRLLYKEVRINNVILEEKVKARTEELYNTQLDLIDRLASAMEFRDNETGMHINRMSHYSECLAKAIGLPAEQCDIIRNASPLHDLGKIGIPDAILLKPGKLTPEEFEIMKTHTIIGGKLLANSQSKLLQVAHEIALTHHERWDGKGYPNGIKEKEIPIVGRICCICDVFDALTSKRPYKEAWSIEKTMEELEKGKGIQFDPFLIEHFQKILPDILKIKKNYDDK